MRIFTSVSSPTVAARIFIGSPMSAPTPAKRDLDLLGGHVVPAVGPYEGIHVRGLRHLDANVDRRIGPWGNVEDRSQRIGILLDQNGDRFRRGDAARDPDRYDGAVFGDLGR